MRSPLDDCPTCQVSNSEDRRHAMMHGELVTQRLQWHLADSQIPSSIVGLGANTAHVTAHLPGGAVPGWGVLEFAGFGTHDRSGIVDWEPMSLGSESD